MDIHEMHLELGLAPLGGGPGDTTTASLGRAAAPRDDHTQYDAVGTTGQFVPVDRSDLPDADGRIHKVYLLDVICGRGRPFQLHPGNIRFLNVVDVFRGRYASVARREKSKVTEEIAEAVQNEDVHHHVRFLRRVDGVDGDAPCYKELSRSEVLDKVSHALRAKVRTPGRVKEQTKRLKEAIRKHGEKNSMLTIPSGVGTNVGGATSGNAGRAAATNSSTATATAGSEAPNTAWSESLQGPTEQLATSTLDLARANIISEIRIAEQQLAILEAQRDLMVSGTPFRPPSVGLAPFHSRFQLGVGSSPFTSNDFYRHMIDRRLNELMLAERVSRQRQIQAIQHSTSPLNPFTNRNGIGMSPFISHMGNRSTVIDDTYPTFQGASNSFMV